MWKLFLVDLAIWLTRIFKFCSVNKTLGPYVTMAGKMMVDMFSFIFLLFIGIRIITFAFIASYCVLLRNHYIIWFKILKSPCVFWNMSPSDNQAPKDMDLDNSSKYNNGTLFYVIRWSICCWYWSMYTRKCRKRLVQARRLVRTGHDDNLSLRFVFNLMLYHWPPYWSGHHFENYGKLQTFFFWIC